MNTWSNGLDIRSPKPHGNQPRVSLERSTRCKNTKSAINFDTNPKTCQKKNDTRRNLMTILPSKKLINPDQLLFHSPLRLYSPSHTRNASTTNLSPILFSLSLSLFTFSLDEQTESRTSD